MSHILWVNNSIITTGTVSITNRDTTVFVGFLSVVLISLIWLEIHSARYLTTQCTYPTGFTGWRSRSILTAAFPSDPFTQTRTPANKIHKRPNNGLCLPNTSHTSTFPALLFYHTLLRRRTIILYKTSHGIENTPPPRYSILTVPNDTSGQLKQQKLLNCNQYMPGSDLHQGTDCPHSKIYPVLFGSPLRLSGRYNNRQRPLPPQSLKFHKTSLLFDSMRSYITFTN
jgi:hypothetical protein